MKNKYIQCIRCKKNGFYNPIVYKENLCNEHYDLKHSDEGVEE